MSEGASTRRLPRKLSKEILKWLVRVRTGDCVVYASMNRFGGHGGRPLSVSRRACSLVKREIAAGTDSVILKRAHTADGIKHLPDAKRLADALMLFDNTAHGRGHRLVAYFHAGELRKLARSVPKWAQKVFGKEFEKWLGSRERDPGRGR